MSEIIELLEKAKNVYSGYGSSERYEKLLFYLDQALTKLREPKCKICKDNKKVEVCDNCYPNKTIQIMQQTDSYPKLIRCVICGKGKPKEIPCPDCQQPPAGELTNQIRQLAKLNFESHNYGEKIIAHIDRNLIFELCDRLDSAEADKPDLQTALEQSKEIFSKKLRSLREKQEKAQENLAFVERRYWSGVYTEIFELRHEIEHILDKLNLNEFCIQMAFMPEERREATIAKAKKGGSNE